MLRFSVDSLTWDPMDGMAPAEAHEQMEEVDGRRVARIRLDADGPAHGGVTHEGSGHLRIDLDAGRLVEWQFTHRMIRTDAQGGRHAMVRDERVVPGR